MSKSLTQSFTIFLFHWVTILFSSLSLFPFFPVFSQISRPRRLTMHVHHGSLSICLHALFWTLFTTLRSSFYVLPFLSLFFLVFLFPFEGYHKFSGFLFEGTFVDIWKLLLSRLLIYMLGLDLKGLYSNFEFDSRIVLFILVYFHDSYVRYRFTHWQSAAGTRAFFEFGITVFSFFL